MMSSQTTSYTTASGIIDPSLRFTALWVTDIKKQQGTGRSTSSTKLPVLKSEHTIYFVIYWRQRARFCVPFTFDRARERTKL